jgi:general secretion pathway protein H
MASGRSRARGFTLFELVIVLLIMAVASAVAAPAITSGWRAREVRSAARQLSGVMRGLRERAVRRGVEQELVLDRDGQTLRWTGGNELMLPGDASVTGVRGGWRDADGSIHVVFYPNGGTTGVALLIAGADDDGLRFAIEVDPLLGSVVVQAGTS